MMTWALPADPRCRGGEPGCARDGRLRRRFRQLSSRSIRRRGRQHRGGAGGRRVSRDNQHRARLLGTHHAQRAGDRAAGGGTEIGVQDGSYIIDVHGGDPNGTGTAFPKSIALAKALIAVLH